MALKHVACLVVMASVVAVASATADFNQPHNVNASNHHDGYHSYHGHHGHHGRWPRPAPHCSRSSREIVVGGDNHWKLGFDYTTWAFRNGPFYVNDTLVFKYDPPSQNNTDPHSVYLFGDSCSFMQCNLTRATMLANWSDGAGDGFKFALATRKPYYFACGASNGRHCSGGLMKFSVVPSMRRWSK